MESTGKETKRKGNYGYMVTLKDIAEKAGVSSMTVSRVMNGKTGAVSQETSERIKKIAQEMGYVPNSSARALASRSCRSMTKTEILLKTVIQAVFSESLPFR